MRDINITREFKGLQIYMCCTYVDEFIDYEFSIKGKVLPMVQIGMITAYCDGGDLLLNDFKDVIGSEIYVPLDYGRVCLKGGDWDDYYTEIFEVGVDEGMYSLEDDKYTMLFYDKSEILEVLHNMAIDCHQLYIKKFANRTGEIKCCGTCIENRIEQKDGYMHCEHFGIPTSLFDAPCSCYSERSNSSQEVIENILEVEEFVF